MPLDEENPRREDNEYGDDIFEIEDQSPSRHSTGDGGLGRRGKAAHGVSKEAGSDTELQVSIRRCIRIHPIHLLFARFAEPAARVYRAYNT